MHIEKVVITNYKRFKGRFELELKDGINILVGDNEAGKSTILEAIHLALTGYLNGRHLRNELDHYLFNVDKAKEYTDSLSTDKPLSPPEISIELFFNNDDCPRLEGDENSNKQKACGLIYKVLFDEEYKSEYEKLLEIVKAKKEDATNEISTIPIEYYKTSWQSFARESVTARSVPYKSVVIDSSVRQYQNGSDIYISRIINNELDDRDKVGLSQAYRKMKEAFNDEDSIVRIKEKINYKESPTSGKTITVSVDLSARRSWDTVLMTYLDDIPFHQIGKGEQCVVKTTLALGHEKAEVANLILMEEPENHLTHSKMNELISYVQKKCDKRQILVSTHSSFVANKLGLEHLILLRDGERGIFSDLGKETRQFFRKLSGYETLRFLLCRKVVLVEGPSDELIVQKAYMNENGKLPITDGVDVISVGTAFKRFLELTKLVKQPVCVVQDNDGNYDKNIAERYENFLAIKEIKICASKDNALETLEPQFLKANEGKIEELRSVLELEKSKYSDEKSMLKYMKANKTKWALRVFETEAKMTFPDYIMQAVHWCND